MKGRYINQSDISRKTKVAVIGRMVAKDLFKSEEAIGKYINLGSSAFKVVGIFQDEGGDNEERNIYIPFTTRQLIEKSNDKVDQIILTYRKELGYLGAMGLENGLKKFFKENTLINQQFIKDSKISISQYLKGFSDSVEVTGFSRVGLV